ncbi:Uma2 family endonuclease [Aquibacillus koreensis]|uniref:Uma2 family endonuclease n=1 Tax=Aquibacillus koreensis TaxID=279446 RepID=A0A9X3WJW5_9BACI|nr:Uma2 family endonuclease [Aquibacillus koreensis]MCT2536821.1 Uma2 family endonuclease [Aquibacillus koreensis]MDC3421422.1 Uma2 family endonuclease [Aquibacillus koreensis]
MTLINVRYSTYEEFESERKNTDERLEFIDGVIYMSPSPDIKHQEISSYLHAQLYNLLRGSKCKVFAAPTDVVFNNVNNDEKKKVVPDLFVACNQDNFTENEYVGAPVFIIEILSPSSKSHDMITKLNLYMNFGVKEYWIVDPMESHIMVYFLDKDLEIQFNLVNLGEDVISNLFKEFKINTSELFNPS